MKQCGLDMKDIVYFYPLKLFLAIQLYIGLLTIGWRVGTSAVLLLHNKMVYIWSRHGMMMILWVESSGQGVRARREVSWLISLLL